MYSKVRLKSAFGCIPNSWTNVQAKKEIGQEVNALCVLNFHLNDNTL